MQTRTSRISVVIPTFREEKYISSILSKLVNIKPKIEIIIVDGGSEDRTVKLAGEFTEKVYQIEERGISKAKNYGASQANGDIVVFLDADVDPPSDFVEKVLKKFRSNTVVGATCYIMPSQSGLMERAFFQFYNLLIRFCVYVKPHARGEFFVVKKTDFLSVKGFNESMPCLEDHDLAFRLSKRGKFVFLDGLIVYESLRRFQRLGFLKVVGRWVTDYVSFVVLGKPLSKVWQPIR